jgi:putative endopeptidase
VANRTIDGFTPPQRCFLACAQLCADKMNEGAMRQLLPVDGHPPGVYRMGKAARFQLRLKLLR